jgi:hypothetical protein
MFAQRIHDDLKVDVLQATLPEPQRQSAAAARSTRQLLLQRSGQADALMRRTRAYRTSERGATLA